MKFNKGDIVWVDFPFTDISQTKPRPALVISNSRVNNTGDYLLTQVTSKVKRDGLSVEIKDDDYKSQPLELKSYIRFHKIFLLNEALILGRKTTVKPSFRRKIVSKIEGILK